MVFFIYFYGFGFVDEFVFYVWCVMYNLFEICIFKICMILV